MGTGLPRRNCAPGGRPHLCGRGSCQWEAVMQLRDSEGFVLAPAFGHERADPATCKHPPITHLCTFLDMPMLMFGDRAAREVEQPTTNSVWAPPDRRGRAGEFWYTTVEWLTTRCMACGTVHSEGYGNSSLRSFHPRSWPGAGVAQLTMRSLLTDHRRKPNEPRKETNGTLA